MINNKLTTGLLCIVDGTCELDSPPDKVEGICELELPLDKFERGELDPSSSKLNGCELEPPGCNVVLTCELELSR